ncbi:MAG: sulfurtransferase [Chloroflexota bacterium]|nr:sulfurtransferase [Chloroflexota bacterium]
MTIKHPEFLAETDWLAAHLNDTEIRVLDCTAFNRPDGSGGIRAESGRNTWIKEHIPGSGHADLVNDLSDKDSRFRYMLPPIEQFARAFSGYGVGAGTQVVLYDSTSGSWATRIWWMLRAFGFDNASVLNGGLHKWKLESRPVDTAPSAYPAAIFLAKPRAGLMANKGEVLTALGQGSTCVLNALSEEQHLGTGGADYGRPGRIANSVNVPAGDMHDPDTHAYLPADRLAKRFADVGTDVAERIITYCGGGIAASNNAFILTLLGYENVAVYDASMSEWASDPSLPMQTG